jgi:hypothetical protein
MARDRTSIRVRFGFRIRFRFRSISKYSAMVSLF